MIPGMLPIDELLPDLLNTLEQQSWLLLQAPPGAGKTTRVPLSLLDARWRGDRRILMLEPRRLAARRAATFMARSLGEAVGQTVGYRTRLDTRVSAHTRIEVVTEGILTRLIQSDPALESYACVIFDEFHERSLQADLGLALIRESSQALREDLRVLIMSATLETQALQAAMPGLAQLTSEGRSHPVETLYCPPATGAGLAAHVAAVIRRALAEQPGSLLVFLPGAGEIRKLERLLAGSLGENTLLTPLYGQMSAEAQDRAIGPAPSGMRKVVLATAIAESSLTIEGVRVVIDAGLDRYGAFDAASGMTRLLTRQVSRASADQRRGRAGRTEPGVCYRLWSDEQDRRLLAQAPPEILSADLVPVVLELAQWGARRPDDLDWIDSPPAAHWQQAVDLLQWLGLLDADGGLTGQGREALAMGVHPRLAHMLLRGRQFGLATTAAKLAALLEERDLLDRDAGCDITARLRLLESSARGARLEAIRRHAKRLQSGRDKQAADGRQLGRLLAQAYPDRIAQRRSGRQPVYQLSNGRGAELPADDALASEPWLAVAALDGDRRSARIFLAAAISEADVRQDFAEHIQRQDRVEWDEARGTVLANRQTRLGALLLEQQPLPEPPAEQIEQALLLAVRRHGLTCLGWGERQRQWQARVALLRRIWPEQWPDVSDQVLLDSLEQWLAPFLAGTRRLSELKKLDLDAVLDALLGYEVARQLKQLAPTRMPIPTGQQVAIDYCAEGGPVLAAKLQALFGWQDTPRVADGRVALVIHLLSPAGRPLAVTSDLASFWRNAYPEVRKDMRGRYPKHPWPQDPLSAPAQAGVKRRN